MDNRSTYGRSDLDVRQMVWRVENIERAVAEFVVSELGLLQRRFLMDDNEGTGVRRRANGIVDEARADHLVGR